MASLSTKLPWELAQTKWASILNPLIAEPIVNGNQIDGVALIINKPQAINHMLGRSPQGWLLVDNTANANVWRTQPFNQYSLTLEASANTTISLWVF